MPLNFQSILLELFLFSVEAGWAQLLQPGGGGHGEGVSLRSLAQQRQVDWREMTGGGG